MTTLSQYTSRLGTILTMVGVAVGLGNVWRFPYMMGSYGGIAFLLIYLAFTLLFAFPALVSEMALGKTVPTGTIDAFKSIFKGRFGKIAGYFFVIVVTIAGSYYAVVVANVLHTSVFSIFSGFTNETIIIYQQNLSNGSLQYLYVVILIITALSVSFLGLKKGIERISKIIMPFFIGSILYLIGYAWSLPGTMASVSTFLTPEFGSIGSTEVFAALGQAFFSIGLGGTFVIVYSGFIPKNENISRIAIFTCLGDLGASVLVSLFLVPTIYLFSIEIDAGPSLIFNTLPKLFESIPGGRWIGSLFLVSLSLVAFLSLVAAFQVPISSLAGQFSSKKKLIVGFGVLQLIITLPSAFYPGIIGPLDMFFGSGMQVLGSVLVVGGIWWGTKNGMFKNILFPQPANRFTRFSIFWLRWAIPITLCIVLITYIISNFS